MNTPTKNYLLTQTLIRFPDIQLHIRDAHKLRGYFGTLFKEYSPLLHNHYEDGRLRYQYPLVQYKIINHQPLLTGINEGAELLIKLFLKIKEININEKVYPIHSKNIETRKITLKDTNNLFTYSFKTLWIALNEKNHNRYIQCSTEERKLLLQKILIGNILSFYKGIGYTAEREILLTTSVIENKTKFKDIDMLAFSGSFVCNAILPDFVGLGKAVSRGFGTILKKQ